MRALGCEKFRLGAQGFSSSYGEVTETWGYRGFPSDPTRESKVSTRIHPTDVICVPGKTCVLISVALFMRTVQAVLQPSDVIFMVI